MVFITYTPSYKYIISPELAALMAVYIVLTPGDIVIVFPTYLYYPRESTSF